MEVSDYNNYVKSHTQSIYRFVCKLLGSRDASKDLVQDTFMRLWEHGQSLDPAKVKSWLYTTSYRLSLVYLEKHKKNVSEEVLLTEVAKASDPPDLKELLDKSMTLLTELQKSTLLLRDYEGYSYTEISEILNISEDSVKVHLFRARQKMKEYIRDIKIIL